MKSGDVVFKTALLLTLFSLVSVMASATYLVNSEDWKDVYSGSYHAFSQGDTPYFVTDNGLEVFRNMPYGDQVNILQSTQNPLASNLAPRVRSQGYQVGNVTEGSNINLDLAPDNSDYVVVPEGYPSAALVAAPYARATDSWVLIVNDQNIGQIQQIIQGSDGETTLIGDFSRNIFNQLEQSADREIISPSKFNLSVQVAEAYFEVENSSRVIISSGDFISRDIVEGESPVLVTGENFLPNTTRDFLFSNPGHSVDTAVVSGNRMTNIGIDIRDENISRNGEVTDDKINVFVKYGQARGDTGIFGISLYPLPTGNLSLSIPSVTYDPESEQLFIEYLNEGPSKMYQLTTFRIIEDGEVFRTGGDNQSIFVGAETSRTVDYDVDISPSRFEEASVEFSTSYGSSPDSLDTFLTEEGAFSPPLTKNISFRSINDSSNVSVDSVTYLEDLDRFRIEISNVGSKSASATARLTDVEVRGQETSFTSDRVEIAPGETKQVYVVAELDDIDVQQNDAVNTVLTYGESGSALINSDRRRMSVEYERSGGVSTAAVAAIILVILIAAGLIYLRYSGRGLQEFSLSK